MSVMARHVHIFWADPRDEEVGARNRAVERLHLTIKAMSGSDAISLAETLTLGFSSENLPDAISQMVESAISAESPAFVMKDKEIQGLVCLAVAALVTIQRAAEDSYEWSSEIALSAALWSSLGFQAGVGNSKLEALRLNLIEASRERVRIAASSSRKRLDVPDVGTLKIDDGDPTTGRANTAYRKATAPVIKALKTNQELDREELDFLWWVVSDYSELLDCQLSKKDAVIRAVVGGLEAASKLRRLPSNGILHAALRGVGESDKMNIRGVLEALGEFKSRLDFEYARASVDSCPSVFPLISGMLANKPPPTSSVALNAREWGARALLEAFIIGMESRRDGGK